MKKSIRILNASHALQYHELLKASFALATGFVVKPEALVWSAAESHFPTFGVFHDEQLISVMRLEWIFTKQELNFKLHTDLEFSAVHFPLAYLTRAGTLPAARNGGFNSLLRYYCLKVALHWKVRQVFGTMVEGSPRIFTLAEMGYEFIKNPIKWNSHFISHNSALIASLDLTTRADRALTYLEKQLGSMLEDYEIQFDIQNIKISETSNSSVGLKKQRPA